MLCLTELVIDHPAFQLVNLTNGNDYSQNPPTKRTCILANLRNAPDILEKKGRMRKKSTEEYGKTIKNGR